MTRTTAMRARRSALSAVAGSLIILASHTGFAAARQHLSLVGAFSNIRFTTKHAYGYEVQLWRTEENRLLGLFMFTEGPQTDFPTSPLEEAKFDPVTGDLTFKSFGSDFSFEGTLRGANLNGQLLRRDPQDHSVVKSRQVHLERNAAVESALHDFESLDAWQKYVAMRLQVNGRRRSCVTVLHLFVLGCGLTIASGVASAAPEGSRVALGLSVGHARADDNGLKGGRIRGFGDLPHQLLHKGRRRLGDCGF